jgi:hypothetical protein
VRQMNRVDWSPFAIIAGVVLFCAGIFWAMMHEELKERRACHAAEQACALYPGDLVHSVLDRARGMVTWSRCGTVRVRFAASTSRTETHVLRPDDTIDREPYAEVDMACYEVQR